MGCAGATAASCGIGATFSEGLGLVSLPPPSAGTASPGLPIQANTDSTGTVLPSACTIFKMVPLTGLGTSVSTLSVLISTKGSYSLTCSPSFFSQRVTVASVTPSPIWGSVTLVAIKPISPNSEQLFQPRPTIVIQEPQLWGHR